MSTYDQLIAEGEAKGKAEGILEGEAKGKAEGIKVGEARGLATSKLMFQALKAGQSVEAIAKQYDLSVDAVLDLKETLI